MRRDDKDAPEILGRLRSHSAEQLDEPAAPKRAGLVGWVITLAILGTIVYVIIAANPL